jgi:prolyl-tRNA synthetase
MTHEEIMTDIARKELRSYKQLPQIWYQIQTKFRDEPRPKSGLLRVRQFTMKDSYSFDLTREGLDKSFDLHDAAYRRIFKRCGLEFVAVEADSGSMGGSQSQEFMVYTDAGEDLVASCGKCGYAANLEKATSQLTMEADQPATASGAREKILTPGTKTIDEVAAFLNVPVNNNMKSLAYVLTDEVKGQPFYRPLLVLMRGNDQMNEAKLSAAIGGREFRPMQEEEIVKYFGSPAGYLGPVGLPQVALAEEKGKAVYAGDEKAFVVLLDKALDGRKNLVGGANEKDHHFTGLNRGVDFDVTAVVDLRNVVEGEGCPRCGAALKLGKTVEIGHIFKLGTKYSESMGARVLDENGKERVIIMGSYGIGVERILTSCIEQNHDDNGFWLAPSIAPFTVVVVPTNMKDATLVTAGEKLAAELESIGYDVLLDDRDERAGVKFKDADLVGIPYRVNIGKLLAEGKVEVVDRATSTKNDVAADAVVEYLRSKYDPLLKNAPQA